MPGNLRKKSGGKGSGRTEKDYLRARRQVLKDSQICFWCGEAIDLKLKPICRFVDTSLATVETDVPQWCTEGGCDHPRKAHPFSGSADHWPEPVSSLPPGSSLLTDPRNMVSTHLKCNRDRGAGTGEVHQMYKTSKDHFA